MNVLIYDIETLLEMFFVGVYNPQSDEYYEFEIKHMIQC